MQLCNRIYYSKILNYVIINSITKLHPVGISTESLKLLHLYRSPNYTRTILSVLLIFYFCGVQWFSIQFREMLHSRSQIGDVRTNTKTKCLKNKFILGSPKAATWYIYFSPCTPSPTVRQSPHYILVSQ